MFYLHWAAESISGCTWIGSGVYWGATRDEWLWVTCAEDIRRFSIAWFAVVSELFDHSLEDIFKLRTVHKQKDVKNRFWAKTKDKVYSNTVYSITKIICNLFFSFFLTLFYTSKMSEWFSHISQFTTYLLNYRSSFLTQLYARRNSRGWHFHQNSQSTNTSSQILMLEVTKTLIELKK